MDAVNNVMTLMSEAEALLERMTPNSNEVAEYPNVIRNGALIEVAKGRYECDCEVHRNYKDGKINKDDMSIVDRYHVNYWEYLDKFKENHTNPNLMERTQCIAVNCDCVASMLKKGKRTAAKEKAQPKVDATLDKESDLELEPVTQPEPATQPEPDTEDKPEVKKVEKPKRSRKPKDSIPAPATPTEENVVDPPKEEKPKRTRKPNNSKATDTVDAKEDKLGADQLHEELKKLNVKDKPAPKPRGKNVVLAMLEEIEDA